MTLFTILRDNREQTGWEFDSFNADVEDVTIKTGDYTIEEFCERDHNGTYHPRYAIERKNGQDFISSITQDRERFKKEIKRASDWESELLVLIEEPRRTFKRQEGFMQYRQVSWPSISGTVEKWERYYNVKFRFVGSRDRAQRIAFNSLTDQLSTILTTK